MLKLRPRFPLFLVGTAAALLDVVVDLSNVGDEETVGRLGIVLLLEDRDVFVVLVRLVLVDDVVLLESVVLVDEVVAQSAPEMTHKARSRLWVRMSTDPASACKKYCRASLKVHGDSENPTLYAAKAAPESPR